MLFMDEYLELGFSQNEAKVYEKLIEFGKLSAAEASGKSGVSYSRIYNVMESLISKGVVSVVPEKTKKFAPANPAAFLNIIEEKEATLKRTREKIKELKKFYDDKKKNPVLLMVGRKGFYEILDELKVATKSSYAIKWTSEFRDDWVRNEEIAIKKGRDTKVLARYDAETEKNVCEWAKEFRNVRKIKNEGVALSIEDGEEVMIALIKSDVSLLIRDRAFAKIMKTLFLAAYDKAEPVK